MITLRPFVFIARIALWAIGSFCVTARGQNASTAADYILRPSDILQVQIFQEPDITREVSVSLDHKISLPLIGTIDVRGRSARAIEEIVRDLYNRDFYVNPQVSLIVLKYAERTVNVIGAVNAPQAVLFPSEKGLTLLDAIARAGGFNRLAKRTAVSIMRTDTEGVSSTITVDATKLISSQSANLYQLEAGDVIFVPEGFL